MGSRVVKVLVEKGVTVKAISQTGKIPEWATNEAWTNSVSWMRGDAYDLPTF